MLFIEEPASLKQAQIALPLNNNRDNLTLSTDQRQAVLKIDAHPTRHHQTTSDSLNQINDDR